MNDLLRESRFHYDWLKRSIERLEERKQKGENTVEMQTGELQYLLIDLLSTHERCDWLTERLCQFSSYAFPLNPIIPAPKTEDGRKPPSR